MTRRALILSLAALTMSLLVTTAASVPAMAAPASVAARAPSPAAGDRADTPETGATVDQDHGETGEPQQPADDPDAHDAAEAARSDDSIGSWALVGAALLAAAIGFGIVFNHMRHPRR